MNIEIAKVFEVTDEWRKEWSSESRQIRTVQESWCVSSLLQPTQMNIAAALRTSVWRTKCVNNCAVLSPSRC